MYSQWHSSSPANLIIYITINQSNWVISIAGFENKWTTIAKESYYVQFCHTCHYKLITLACVAWSYAGYHNTGALFLCCCCCLLLFVVVVWQDVVLDAPDSNNKTPLLLAIGRDHKDVVHFLQNKINRIWNCKLTWVSCEEVINKLFNKNINKLFNRIILIACTCDHKRRFSACLCVLEDNNEQVDLVDWPHTDLILTSPLPIRLTCSL